MIRTPMLALALAILAITARAQPARVYFARDDETQRDLDALALYQREARWPEALDSVRSLLARLSDPTATPGLYGDAESEVRHSLEDELQARLARWSAPGVAAFRATYEARARFLFERGRAAGRPPWEVARFFPTEAAGDALAWIAAYHLERGEATLALRALVWVGDHPDRPIPERARAFRLALAWSVLGRGDRALAALSAAGTAPIKIAGELVTPGEAAARFDFARAPVTPRADWPMRGGAPSRDAVAQVELSLGAPRYDVDATALTPSLPLRRARAARGLPPLVPGPPATAAGRIFAAGPAVVAAWDAATGELAWQFPDAPDPAHDDPGESACAGVHAEGDALYATTAMGVFRLDAHAGKLAWAYRIDPKEAQFGDRVTALSGPLLIGDHVVVVVTRVEGDVRTHVLALDRATGAVVHRALLTTSPSPTALGYGYPAATPSLAAGELVIGTEHGALVALDPATLAPRWGLAYPRHPDAVLARLVEERRLRAPRPVAIVGSVYCMAPTDSPYALGIDAVARAELWRHPLDLDETLYAACREIVIVGGRTLRGLAPQTGIVRWQRELGAPAADVLLTGERELLVSAGSELLRLDRSTGALLARRLVPHPGRLAPCTGGLAILGAANLALLAPADRTDGSLAGQIRALQELDPDDERARTPALGAEVATGDEAARRAWADYARLRLSGHLSAKERARWLAEAARVVSLEPEHSALVRAWAGALAALPARDDVERASFAAATAAVAALDRPVVGVLDDPRDALAPDAESLGTLATLAPTTDAEAVAYPPRELARLLGAAPRQSPPAPDYDAISDPGAVDAAWLDRPEVQEAIARDPGRMRTVLAHVAGHPHADPAIARALADALANVDHVPALAPPGSTLPRLAWKSALPTSLVGAGVRELPVLGACAPAMPFPIGLAGDQQVQLRDGTTGALVWREAQLAARPLGVATVDDRGLVLFGGMLLAIDLATAEPCWAYAPSRAAPLTRAELATSAWRDGIDGSALVAMACRPGAVYAAGHGGLVRLDPATGAVQWRASLAAPPLEGCLVAARDRVYVGLAPGTIAAYGADGATGQGIELPPVVGTLTALERRDHSLLAHCLAARRAHWLRLDLGALGAAPRIAWTVEGARTAHALPSGGRELVLDDEGMLEIHDGATGRPRWTADHRGAFAVSRVCGGMLVVAWRAGAQLACAGRDLVDGRKRWTAVAPAGPVPADVVPIGDTHALIRAAEPGAACLLADGESGTILEHRLDHHHGRIERLVPAGSTIVVDTDAGLVGLALEPDEVLRAELHRAWPRRAAPLVAPTVSRALSTLRDDLGAGARQLARSARSVSGGWPMDLRVIDLVQGGHEAAGDARTGRRVIQARRFAQPPVIDGLLNERWDIVTSETLDGHDAIRLLLDPSRAWAPWRGVSDHSMRLFLGWDDAYLYIAMRVRDQRNTMFDEEDGGGVWSGDVVFFSFDPADDGGYAYNQYEDYAFWFYNPKPRKRQPPPANPGDRKPTRRTVEGALTAIDWNDENHRTYELAVPWSLLRRFGQPAVGKRLGFDVLMLDDDSSTGCTRGLSLSPGNLLDHARTDNSFIKRFHAQRFPAVELVR